MSGPSVPRAHPLIKLGVDRAAHGVHRGLEVGVARHGEPVVSETDPGSSEED